MDKSKEEMQKRLTELKKELARKQRKLEKSRRIANIRAHVRQKVNELNEKEQHASLLNDKILEENIPLQTSFPVGASNCSTDICQLMPTKLVSKVNVDDSPILSATDSWLDTKITFKESNMDTNVMPEKEEKFKDKTMSEADPQPNSSFYAASDTSIKGKDFILNTMLSKSAGSKISNKSEIKMHVLKSKKYSRKDHIQMKSSLDFNNVKKKFESTISSSNRTRGATCDDLRKLNDKTKADGEQRREIISNDPNTENVFIETQQCLTNMNMKNQKLLINDEPAENIIACSQFSDIQTATEKAENEKNNIALYRTNSMSDLEFLQILGVTQTKSVESLLQADTNILSTSPLGEESTLVPSSPFPTPEAVTSPAVSKQCPIQNIMQPNMDKVSPSTKDQSLFLDYTELDAIPFTKFELEEDFLSEVSENSQSSGSCTNHPVRNALKVGPLIKRRSSRISEFNLHSHLNSSKSDHFGAGSKRRLSEQEKVVAIRSIFQFLKEEAIKPKWSSDFDLPESFQSLQKLKQINPSLSHNRLECNISSQKDLVSSEEKKIAGLCSRKLNGSEVNICDGQSQPLKNSSETVLNMSKKCENKNAFVRDEVKNHTLGLVDKELNCPKQSDNNLANIKISLLQNHSQSPCPLSLTNETNTDHSDVFTSPPSPIAHVMTEGKTSLHEASVYVDYCKTDYELKASGLGLVLGDINLVSNQKLPCLIEHSSLLTTSTPKAVKIKPFSPKLHFADTLEKSAILFEGENQQDNPVTPSSPRINLLGKNVLRNCESPNLEIENNIDWKSQKHSHHIQKKKQDFSPGICTSPSHSMIHLSQMSSVGYSPIQLIQPWKKFERTPLTPLQILEDKRNENDQSPLVYIPARRLSRSQLSETEPKTLKFSGCFQSCSGDAVISILCGSLLTEHKDLVQYLVSVQATSLTVWTKDDHLGWTTELKWSLPPENHLIQAQLLPVTDTDRIVIIACGWDGGLLFVSLFLYDCQTDGSKRFNVQVSELSNGIRSPTNAIIETVSTTEILLGVTNDTLHVLGKIDLSADLSNEKTTCFPKQRGQLLSIITMTGQESTCISLSSSQNITIWNTCYGIAIKSIELPVHVPCLTKLLKAKNYQGTILLEALWKVEQECGGLLIINPLTNIIKMLKTYCVPNSTWKCTQSAKIEVGLVAGISSTGSFCLWQSQNGKLVCHSKSRTTTALSVMKSDQSLVVGEIQGCLHLYKLAL